MLTLRWKAHTTVPVEAECITPDHLAGKSAEEVRALVVHHGNRREALGEFFDVAGDACDRQVAVEGDCSRVKLIGAGMTAGRITIAGNAGMHLGAEMRGGCITVQGNCSDWVGAEMRGGLIHVQGDAGHLVGAAYRGSQKGMRGGVILVNGQAGNEIGSAMRRGLVAVGGKVGDFPGVSMIAGSLFLFGRTGVRVGAGMKRGSIVLFDSTPEATLLPTFRFNCPYHPVFLSVYLRQLRLWGFPVADNCLHGLFRTYSGDLVALGKGEILVWQADN